MAFGGMCSGCVLMIHMGRLVLLAEGCVYNFAAGWWDG